MGEGSWKYLRAKKNSNNQTTSWKKLLALLELSF